MLEYNPQLHAELPLILFFKKNGEPRKQLPSLNDMNYDDIESIKSIRDELLNTYFPASSKISKAKVKYGLSTSNTIYTFTAGKYYNYKKQPYLYVADEDSIEYEESLKMWIKHITGIQSIFSNFDGELNRKSILLDIDCPKVIGNAYEAIKPWDEAIKTIEQQTGITIPVKYMLSGNKGFWMHIELVEAVDTDTAIWIAISISYIVSKNNKVNICAELMNKIGIDTFNPYFVSYIDADYILDSGNLNNRNCRLPYAKHQTTQEIAKYIDFNSIGSFNLNCSFLEKCSVSDWNSVFQTILPDDLKIRQTAHTDVDSKEARETSLEKEQLDGITDLEILKTEWERKQWIYTVEYLMGVTDTVEDVNSLIPDLVDGSTYNTLVTGGVLLRVYAWFKSHNQSITVEDILRILKPHYLTVDKTEEIRRVVEHDFKHSKHLTASLNGLQHPCVKICEAAAIANGISLESSEFMVLIALANKPVNEDGLVTSTNEEIAKCIGNIPMDEKLSSNERKTVGRRIMKLVDKLNKAGLVERVTVGHSGGFSTFRLTLEPQ